jgi:hypothetical protein
MFVILACVQSKLYLFFIFGTKIKIEVTVPLVWCIPSLALKHSWSTWEALNRSKV